MLAPVLKKYAISLGDKKIYWIIADIQVTNEKFGNK